MTVISGNIVTEPNGCHGDETIVEWVQIIPIILNECEDGSGNEDDKHDEEGEDDRQVDQPDMEGLVEVTKALAQRLQQEAGDDHQTLYESREHDERQRNPDNGVHDAEDLAALRQGCHSAIAWKWNKNN